MTTLISVQSLYLDTGHGPLCQDLSFTVAQGDRIGLLGHNGSGKSSLLGALAGTRETSAGRVEYAGACRMQYVEQHLPPMLAGLGAHQVLWQAVDLAEAQRWRVDRLLAELELEHAAHVPVAELSGGQHTRLLLGRAVLRQPNLLLLDEPSNHLDLPSLLWLENFLQRWSGGLIMVSHDTRLLDNVTDKSWILRDRRLYGFNLPCSQALAELAAADEAGLARNAGEQKEIDRLTDSSKRLAIWGREHDNEKLIRKAKSMQKRIDKLKEVQTFVSQGSPWQLRLQGQRLTADRLMVFEGLSVRSAPDQPPLFDIDGLSLGPNDKVALLGANGTGKSSLLRQCWRDVRQDEYQPGWRCHPSARIAYYDQSLRQLVDEAMLPDALYPFAPLADAVRRQALIGAGFAYARHGQRVSTLSGGERARLLFLALSLANHHLLWLDEPTNHLDLDGKRDLTHALAEFPGALILVSHDRELIERTCRRFWVLRDGRVLEWPDAASAYQALFTPVAPPGEALAEPVRQAAAAQTGDDAEAQWQRWCQLQDLLAADLARKPKHRTPRLQQAWQAEMRQLEQALGL